MFIADPKKPENKITNIFIFQPASKRSIIRGRTPRIGPLTLAMAAGGVPKVPAAFLSRYRMPALRLIASSSRACAHCVISTSELIDLVQAFSLWYASKPASPKRSIMSIYAFRESRPIPAFKL